MYKNVVKMEVILYGIHDLHVHIAQHSDKLPGPK